jgi:hypothetical protein
MRIAAQTGENFETSGIGGAHFIAIRHILLELRGARST